MKERPILFSGPMVRAILEGRKTQTRRPCGNRVAQIGPTATWFTKKLGSHVWESGVCPWHCPHGRAGDRLWLKETHWRFGIWRKNGLTKSGKQRWKFVALPHDLGVQFSAPEPTPNRGRKGWHKRPAIFMHRRASRITLEVTRVRAERLQDIDEGDAKAEGCRDTFSRDSIRQIETCTPAKINFLALWDSINADRGFGWDVNPWVWVIEFRRIKP